ncbi:hypothetical protein AVEN_169440-1 [Araneus ventricosus]|uniref:Uncharacterized protein n=1 Tax=Araneus ventricosus TaxID=182803 RepID=A0A4Y2LIX9_ARAVE|nr:hypothetical protein AVEN_169440-1 [Araneus ventricosus]
MVNSFGDSRLDARDRRRLRSQISARDSALVRACLDPVELKPAFGLIAPLEICNALEHSFVEIARNIVTITDLVTRITLLWSR